MKASSFTVEGYSLNYEDFCGFDIGEYDGFSQVLAIITTNVTYLLCPADKKDKDEWTENISQVSSGFFMQYTGYKNTGYKNKPVIRTYRL